jgi:CheY-like chemotaxis protein
MKPDLITLDITMPDQSGIRTFRNLRNDPNLKDIPVLVITATVNSPQNFLDLLNGFPGPEGFLNKPINTKELINKTKTLLTGQTG